METDLQYSKRYWFLLHCLLYSNSLHHGIRALFCSWKQSARPAIPVQNPCQHTFKDSAWDLWWHLCRAERRVFAGTCWKFCTAPNFALPRGNPVRNLLQTKSTGWSLLFTYFINDSDVSLKANVAGGQCSLTILWKWVGFSHWPLSINI